jgi:hypothetical protein
VLFDVAYECIQQLDEKYKKEVNTTEVANEKTIK